MNPYPEIRMKGCIPFTINHGKVYTVSELIADLTRVQQRGGGNLNIYLDYDQGTFCTNIEIHDHFINTETKQKTVTVSLG